MHAALTHPESKVADVMTETVLTIEPRRSLNLAAQMMLWGGFRHLPVVKDGTLVGILSQADLYEAKCDWAKSTAADAMTTEVETASPHESLSVAADRMARARIDSLPVVDEGQLVGIVTSTDVLAHVGQRHRQAAGSGRHVDDIMNPCVRTLPSSAVLSDAVILMIEQQVRHLPIVNDDGELVGMLSDRDVRTAIGDPVATLREGSISLSLSVEDVMTHSPIAVHPSDPVDALAWPLLDERVGAVPVVDDGDHPVGIVSYVDVVQSSLVDME